MAYGNIKQLASQTLHATESIIYSAPVSKSAEIATLWFHNPTATPQGVIVWFPFTASQATGSFSASLSLQRLNEAVSSSITMEISPKVPFVLDGNLNEKITMKCTQSSSINVIMFGREEI
jgi:hypothetical protein